MALFLLFIIVAIALGIIGVVVKGLFWLLVIGVLVVIVDLIVLGGRLSRRRSRPRPSR
jgi:membrane protein implicated in regulation of membrane protease activity